LLCTASISTHCKYLLPINKKQASSSNQ